MKVKVIGAGGIGCQLLPTLCRYLYHLEGEHTVTLIDGDSYEPTNAPRQCLYGIGNKAEVAASNLLTEFPGMAVEAQGVYITDENCYGIICDGDVVFCCVDNHATRKTVSDRCEDLWDVTLISGGNEMTDGNIQVFVRKGAKSLTLPLANEYHPEISIPADKNPAELGCQVAAESSPQLLIMNNLIAALMLNAFYAATIDGVTGYDEVYADIVKNKVVPYNRTGNES